MKAGKAGAALLAVVASAGRAAGGHHDVDDATVLENGHCQVETWILSGHAPALGARHVGPACNFDGREWGFNADLTRLDGERTDTFGPQLKWVADPTAKRLSVGAVAALSWRDGGPRRPALSAYVPATLWLGTNGELQLQLNLGRDHVPSDGHFRRWGAGADWTLNDRFVLTIERRSLFGQELSRLGLRLNLTPLISVDTSVARGGDSRLFGLGLNWEWQR